MNNFLKYRNESKYAIMGRKKINGHISIVVRLSFILPFILLGKKERREENKNV